MVWSNVYVFDWSVVVDFDGQFVGSSIFSIFFFYWLGDVEGVFFLVEVGGDDVEWIGSFKVIGFYYVFDLFLVVFDGFGDGVLIVVYVVGVDYQQVFGWYFNDGQVGQWGFWCVVVYVWYGGEYVGYV